MYSPWPWLAELSPRFTNSAHGGAKVPFTEEQLSTMRDGIKQKESVTQI
jgi:hypothetical protein